MTGRDIRADLRFPGELHAVRRLWIVANCMAMPGGLLLGIGIACALHGYLALAAGFWAASAAVLVTLVLLRRHIRVTLAGLKRDLDGRKPQDA